MSKVRSGPLTPCPSPREGEGSFFIRMRSAPPLPFRERGLGGEDCPATTRLCTCPGTHENAMFLMNANNTPPEQRSTKPLLKTEAVDVGLVRAEGSNLRKAHALVEANRLVLEDAGFQAQDG